MSIINFREISKRRRETATSNDDVKIINNFIFPNVKEFTMSSNDTYYISNQINEIGSNFNDHISSKSSSAYESYLLEREKEYDRREDSYNKALRKYFLAGSLH